MQFLPSSISGMSNLCPMACMQPWTASNVQVHMIIKILKIEEVCYRYRLTILHVLCVAQVTRHSAGKSKGWTTTLCIIVKYMFTVFHSISKRTFQNVVEI